MNLNLKSLTMSMVAALAVASASAEMMDRPVGIRIGQRMTLKPYVALSASYDSNVDSRKDGGDSAVWLVNPGLTLEYKAEYWLLMANLFYQYNAYSKKSSYSSTNNRDYHGYGEDLTYRWTDSTPGEAGWSLMLSEKFKSIAMAEDYTSADGVNYSGDKDEFKFAAAVERRFTDKLHADVNASYYWLEYDNDNSQSSYGLYGWDRWLAGAEVGYAFSHWTDALIAGSYQGYKQDNTSSGYYNRGGYSSESQGYTIQGGIGSYATDKITYRALAGWSVFEYADADTSNGFSYTLSGNWRISDTWNTMLLGTSYYQPSEREYASATRVDSLSWGINHTMVHGKLTGAFDVAYRRETKEYSGTGTYDYDLDRVDFRLNLNYILNRYITIYLQGLYCLSEPSGGNTTRGDAYDYDRFRATIGVRLTY